MSKEKTAMQMLIEELDKLGKLGILVDSVKNVAEQLLQKEQEQIEKAYESGNYDGSWEREKRGKDYYQSKYGG